MKLSEAIRQGAQKRPQAFGSYAQMNASMVICSCALGAAHEAVQGTLPSKELPVYEMCEMFDPMPPAWLLADVVDYNDVCKWDRERIADWVAEKGF